MIVGLHSDLEIEGDQRDARPPMVSTDARTTLPWLQSALLIPR